jgi:hypothetical protein
MLTAGTAQHSTTAQQINYLLLDGRIYLAWSISLKIKEIQAETKQ